MCVINFVVVVVLIINIVIVIIIIKMNGIFHNKNSERVIFIGMRTVNFIAIVVVNNNLGCIIINEYNFVFFVILIALRI